MERYPAYIYTPSGKLEKITSSSEKKQVHKKKAKQEEIDEGRRTVLKGIGAAGVMAALGMGLRLGSDNDSDKQIKSEAYESAGNPAREEETSAAQINNQGEATYNSDISLSITEPSIEDAASFSSIVKYDGGGKHINLDKDTPTKVKNYWLVEHRLNPKRLRRGVREMNVWMDHIDVEFKTAFQGSGLPEQVVNDLKYLALAETYFGKHDRSKVGAAGPYQIMAKTGRKWPANLQMNNIIDERIDPIMSARACARILRDNFDKIGDIRLAISCYNGGFAWHYVSEAKKMKIKPTYDGFLEYMEHDINSVIDKIKDGLEYTVKGKDSLRFIALRFRHAGYETSIDDIAAKNGLHKSSILKIGQKLMIPISEADKKKIFENKVRGYVENLNYPPKYEAIAQLVNNGFINEKKETINFVETNAAEVEISIKKRETKFSKKLNLIRRKKLSLKTIANDLGHPLEQMVSLNPAIKNPKEIIEDKLKQTTLIRLPA